MHPDSVTDYVKKFRNKYNICHFSPHSLRHTNISHMIEQGVDIKTVSSRVGHADVMTTLRIYAHQIKSADTKAMEKIGNVFGSPLKEGQI